MTSAPVPLPRRLAAEFLGSAFLAAIVIGSGIGRMFSNTFAGIAPSSAPSFIGAQVIGGVLAWVIIRTLYPSITPAQAADIIVPHRDNQAGPETARAASDGASPGIRPPGHGQTPD